VIVLLLAVFWAILSQHPGYSMYLIILSLYFVLERFTAQPESCAKPASVFAMLLSPNYSLILIFQPLFFSTETGGEWCNGRAYAPPTSRRKRIHKYWGYQTPWLSGCAVGLIVEQVTTPKRSPVGTVQLPLNGSQLGYVRIRPIVRLHKVFSAGYV